MKLFYLPQRIASQTEFTEIESLSQQYVSKYSSRTINLIKPFDSFVPNMENLGYVLFVHLSDLLKDKNWELKQIEITQNQARAFTIRNTATLDEKILKYILETPAFSFDVTRKDVIMRERKRIRKKRKRRNALILKILSFMFTLIFILFMGYKFFPDLYIGIIQMVTGS